LRPVCFFTPCLQTRSFISAIHSVARPYKVGATDFTEQSPPSEGLHSATQEIPRLLWDQKVHYLVRPPVPLVRPMDQIQISQPCVPKIHCNISLSPTSSSEWSLPFRLSIQSFVGLRTSHVGHARASSPTLIIFRKEYKL
jgi:hypothetical protein